MQNTKQPSFQEIQGWLLKAVAEELERPLSDQDLDTPLAQLGLDSTQAVALTGELEDWLGVEVDPTLVFEFPSIRQLSQHLASA